MRLCVNKYQWNNLPNTADYRRFSKEDYDVLKLTNRPMGQKWYYDCFYSERRLRPVPTSCYGDWDQWSLKETFYKFLSEVFNDWRFMYDFVLYEPNQQMSLENMLWYNILYLKQLVIHIPNPFSIVERVNVVDKIQRDEKRVNELEKHNGKIPANGRHNQNVIINTDSKVPSPDFINKTNNNIVIGTSDKVVFVSNNTNNFSIE